MLLTAALSEIVPISGCCVCFDYKGEGGGGRMQPGANDPPGPHPHP